MDSTSLLQFLDHLSIPYERHEHVAVYTSEQARRLGVEPGAVSLMALVNDPGHAVEVLIDRDIWQAPAVHCHPLVNTATLVIPLEGIRAFLAATGHTPRLVDIG